MKKTHKLAVLLLLCTAILLFLWLRADRPCLTEQSVLNRLERANLVEESRLLDTRFVIFASYNSSPQYEEYLAAGITDTHLHITRLWKRSFLWYPPKGRTTARVYAYPLEEAVVGVAPVEAANVCFFCYTALPAAQYQARLTVGEVTLTASGPCAEEGFTLFGFEKDPLTSAAYDELEVALLDADGNLLTTVRRAGQ